MRMPRLWKYWQLSNCHRHALREWLLALKRANLAGRPHRRDSCVIRPLPYFIKITFDGGCDHNAKFTDENLHCHAAQKPDPADSPPFCRGAYVMIEGGV